MFILEVARGCPTEEYPLYGIFEMDQAKALKAAGHKVVYAAVDVRSIRRKRRFGVFKSEKDGIMVYNFSFPIGAADGIAKAVGRRGFELLLKKIIEDYGRPDIVHAHFSDVAAVVCRCCKKENIPYVVTEHSSNVNQETISSKFKAELCESYKNAAAVVAVSSALGHRIEKHTGVRPVVIPNIIDLSSFSVVGQPECKFRFISAGNLKESKAFDVLIKAFAIVHKKRPDSKLLIMGSGADEGRLKKLAEKENIGNSVQFFGAYSRNDFAEKLSSSDVFVLPSRSETFGVVYAEAMAAGRPVIATRCGGPEDFVNEKCGMLVEIDDVNGLALSMEKMGCTAIEYDSEYISDYICSCFSATNVSEKLTILFNTILE